MLIKYADIYCALSNIMFSPCRVRNVRVTIANATALLVSWDVLQVSHGVHYTIYYSEVSKELHQVVNTSTKVVSANNTSDIINVRELTAGVEHQFQVTTSLEIDEVVYERMIFMPAVFLFAWQGTLVTWMHITNCPRLFQAQSIVNIIISQMKQCMFQLQMGPVTHCTTWSVSKINIKCFSGGK